jgi:hypothetical protein
VVNFHDWAVVTIYRTVPAIRYYTAPRLVANFHDGALVATFPFNGTVFAVQS